jgi:molecular chaperone HscB
MSTDNCWKCGEPSKESLFCNYCSTLQAPVPDYYKFLGLERRLSLDPAELQERFYELSRQIHPDRFLRQSPNEQRYSLEATAILNDAYRVLKDPVTRAEYVLKEADLDAGERKAKTTAPKLIEEVFDLNIALEEIRAGDYTVRPQLEEGLNKFQAMKAEIDLGLENLFAEYDRTQDRRVLIQIRHLLDRRRYVHNLASEVKKELAV